MSEVTRKALPPIVSDRVGLRLQQLAHQMLRGTQRTDAIDDAAALELLELSRRYFEIK